MACRVPAPCRVLALAATALLAADARAQVTMSIPTNLSVAPGGTINVPVNLQITGNSFTAANGNGLSGIKFVVTYDPTLPSSIGTIQLGSLISNPSYGFGAYTVNNTSGQTSALTTATTGTPALANGTSGTVALMALTVSNSATPGVYPLTLIGGGSGSSVADNNFFTYSTTSSPALTLSSGSLTVTAVPEPGTFALAGMAAAGLGWLRRRRH
jgi:uncharacterized protein (TIGR03382 family)